MRNLELELGCFRIYNSIGPINLKLIQIGSFNQKIVFDPNRKISSKIKLSHIITTEIHLVWFKEQKKEDTLARVLAKRTPVTIT